VGELPPFNFASDVNPWCLCQENLPWNAVVVEKLNNTKFFWKWGDLKSHSHQNWQDFKYEFEVTREDSVWKINVLAGFDLEKIN
jgi:hypothetical protein